MEFSPAFGVSGVLLGLAVAAVAGFSTCWSP
jgi:hypothetical protein